ncbi:MAG: IS256 family transposase [Simkania sp.]|nr:IS256 family transposase [Simkania sp.]
MTDKNDYSLGEQFLELLGNLKLDELGEGLQQILNLAMKLERQDYLGLKPYERSQARKDYANGFKPKTVITRLGELNLDIPQVRSSLFYPSSLEKGRRSERALVLALAEMYVQGVSTRKVSKIIEEHFGSQISSTQVSQATKQLDATLSSWRNRPLGQMHYLYLDARYEKVRMNGQIRDAAVLIAVGVDLNGKRQILGVSVSLSEHEVHWREFLQSLTKRGLSGVKLIISDAHSGLGSARKAVFGGIKWQRCQFHLQQNAQAYVPKVEMKKEVASDIRTIFNATDKVSAKEQLERVSKKYKKSAPKLSMWMEENIEEGLTFFDFEESHWRRLRTSNGLERLNREVKRRTRVASIFPNEESCLRLVSAVLMEISEEWEAGKAYLTFP